MGFLNIIKEKIKIMINRSKTKSLPEAQENAVAKSQLSNYELKEMGLNTTVTLSDNIIRNIASIRESGYTNYPDGTVKKLMIAEVSNDHTEAMHLLSGPEFSKIIFEMPQEEVFSQTILNKIVQYSEAFRKQNAQQDIYIGELNGNPQDLQIKLTDFVQNDVNNKLIPSFQNERNQEKTNSIQRNTIQNSFDESLRVNLEEINRAKKQEKQQRLQNPFFIDIGRTNRNPELANYNGVNLTNGEILRIRNLSKVGKDENGIYLYQGFIASTTESSNTISGDNYIGGNYVPICFTLGKKIEDIIQGHNVNEINSMLSMLSQPQIFSPKHCPKNQLNYIGSLVASDKMQEQTNILSNTMRNAIHSIQTEFSGKIKSQESNYYGK